MIERLVKIINTLNSVEVHGKSNLMFQLGAIQELEAITRELSVAPKEKQKPAEVKKDG